MNGLRKAPGIDSAKIAVEVESKFIPEEIWGYLNGFPLLGAEVELISRIWYGDYKPAVATVYSNSDPADEPPWTSPQKIDVRRNLASHQTCRRHHVGKLHQRAPALSRGSARRPVAVRSPGPVQAAPVVRFFAEAMQLKQVVKGLLCHGLWVLAQLVEVLENGLKQYGW